MRILLLLAATFLFIAGYSQNAAINDTGNAPDASAILDVSSTSQGLLAPRMATSERTSIASPATGLLVYDTDLGAYYSFNGSEWDATSTTGSGSQSSNVPSNPSAGQRYYDEVGGVLYIYTGTGWSSVTASTPASSPYDGGGAGFDDITISFGTVDGNSITIDSWTDVSATGYAIAINTADAFTSIVDGSEPCASVSYQGYGEQVVYLGSSISSVEVSLLQNELTYYFKIYPYTGDYSFDETQASTSQAVSTCVTTNTTESQVCFDYTETLRTIWSNQLPEHATGSFPNADVTAIEVTRNLTADPQLAGTTTYVYDETGQPTPSNPNFWQFGMAINGVEFHPMGLKPWSYEESDGSGGTTTVENWEWQAAVVDAGQTFLDNYGAHVTSAGLYHYHGDIVGLADEDGTRHSQIYGYAADGFPIYYKYGYTDASDKTTTIKELVTSYQLKSGTRPGDGTTAPDGSYDGTYIQDYEFIDGLGDLDECNGRYGVTPEYPNGIYYYVITADFPKVPNCFKGTPDEDWIIGQ